MKYLFFDIECADGGKATVCSFGYVIADEKFNIIEKKDIIMNPDGEFFLEGRVGRPDVKLAYTRECFERAPKFPCFYEQIKNLLENENYRVLGHAVINDVMYLNKVCKRYKLPALKFSYFDIQRFYREVTGDPKTISLENAIVTLEIECNAQYHRSDEDAYASLLVFKKLLEKKGTTFAEYIATSNFCTGTTEKYHWKWDLVPKPTQGAKQYSLELRRGERENQIREGRKNHVLFLRYLDYGKEIGELNDKLKAKRISISKNYEREHFKEMIRLVGLIKAAGGEYILKASDADIFASFDELSEDGNLRCCTRKEYVKQAIENGANIKIMTFDDLLILLGSTRQELESAPALEIDYLLDEQYNKKAI